MAGLVNFRALDGRTVLTAVCLGLSMGMSTYAAYRASLSPLPTTVVAVANPTPVPTPEGTVEVMTAADDYAPGHRFVGPLAILGQRVAADTVPSDALTRSSELQGRVVGRQGIKRGDIFTTHALLPN
jgi:hypothetical protein